MSRRAPKIIDSYLDKTVEYELTESTGLWAVLKQGKTFNLRRSYPHAKNKFTYPKSLFPSRGHAVLLAKKLNRMFDCNEFEVVNIMEIIENYE